MGKVSKGSKRDFAFVRMCGGSRKELVIGFDRMSLSFHHVFGAVSTFALRIYFQLREYIRLNYGDRRPDAHSRRVGRVMEAVKRRNALPPNERKLMCTARPQWMNLSTRFATYKKSANCIDTSSLNNILMFDPDRRMIRLEPLVEVGAVARFLLPQGYMLETTLEIEEATIGGLAMAVGMTTRSHICGLLQETVLEYEVVLGDGRLVRATRTHNEDLFYALPWSHGSLGITLRVIPVKPFVRVEYHTCFSQEKYCEVIRRLALKEGKETVDFVEATVFSRNEAVVTAAYFDDLPPTAFVNRIGLWYKPWYYKHVESFLNKGRAIATTDQDTPSWIEYIPTYHYIFRHNRAIFWTLRDLLPEYVGNSLLFRLFLGWLCPPKVTFLKLPVTNSIREEIMTQRVYQDIMIPLNHVEEAINTAANLFDIWPILIYPSRLHYHGDSKRSILRKPRQGDFVKGTNYSMYCDVGIYGIPRAIQEGKPFRAIHHMREMEHLTRRLHGAPFLYADTFMDEREFEQMFDLSNYRRVRKLYRAEGNFPDVYTKTQPDINPWQWMEKEKLLESS